ncbi:MAG: acetate--CoA ligase family protein [Acidimicrobiia bacterium]
MTPLGLSMILDPKTVAVIGASRDPVKRGYQAVRRLVDDEFPGAIYPINPGATEIAGIRAYASLDAVPEEVDLALIVRPAEKVPEALEACGHAGVKGAIVIAVGFRESGERGRQLEEAVVEIARRHSIQLVGPNTSGVFNTHANLNVVGVKGVRRGHLSVLSQSGNVLLGLLNEAQLGSDVGFASYVGLGNEAVVRFHECLAVFRTDPHTAAIIVYAEGFRDGPMFLEELHRTVPEKPVVVHKSGRSDAGTRSAASHTGALAGSFDVADSALRQAGAVTVHRLDELLPVAQTLAFSPPMQGPRVAVVADGGGHATMAADALVERGLIVESLSADTQETLRRLLGTAAAVSNPVDVAGAADTDPEVLATTVEAVLADAGIDGVLLVGLFGGYARRFSESLAPAEENTSRVLAALTEAAQKPLIVQSIYAGFKPGAHAVLTRAQISVHQSIDIAARCVSALRERGAFLSTYSERSSFVPAISSDKPMLGAVPGMLPEHEARQILDRFDIPVGAWRLATTPHEAERAGEAFGTHLALKVVSRDIVHKSDAGGVLLDIHPKDAAQAFEDVADAALAYDPTAHVEGVLVSPMVDRGLELIVGMTRDETFGPILMVGLGGVMVDVIGGAAFRVLPVTRQEAWDLTCEFRSGSAFSGYRGFVPDRDALVDLLVSASNMAQAEAAITEFDFNPVILGPDGAIVVDARIVVDDLD